jgi:hypothetical protein
MSDFKRGIAIARLIARTLPPALRDVPIADRAPSIFDLLEPLSDAYPQLKGGFARGTGGVDLPFILEVLTRRADQTDRLIGALRSFRSADTEFTRASNTGEQPRLNKAGTRYAIAKHRLFRALEEISQ